MSDTEKITPLANTSPVMRPFKIPCEIAVHEKMVSLMETMSKSFRDIRDLTNLHEPYFPDVIHSFENETFLYDILQLVASQQLIIEQKKRALEMSKVETYFNRFCEADIIGRTVLIPPSLVLSENDLEFLKKKYDVVSVIQEKYDTSPERHYQVVFGIKRKDKIAQLKRELEELEN